MSKLTGITYFVLTDLGPALITGWDNDVWFATDLEATRTLAAPTFLSPIYKTLEEFQSAYPELFI